MAMRARQVRELLQGNVDPRLLKVLESLAEQQHHLDKGLGECAQMIVQMEKIITDFVGVAENMKKKVLEIEGRRIPQDDAQ